MSHALGVAAVTAAFSQRIAQAITAVANLSAAPEVRHGSPATDVNFVGANVFLCRASPSPARRNIDILTRQADGTLRQRPTAAIDLDYLVSFHGDETALEPQRLLGAVIVMLHAFPLFTAAQVNAAISASGQHGPLGGAIYDDGAEPVRFTLHAQDMDVIQKIWSLFPTTPYALSLAYGASTVMMRADLTPVVPPLATQVTVTAPPTLPPGPP